MDGFPRLRLASCSAIACLIAASACGGGWVSTWGGTGKTTANGVALDREGNAYVAGGFGGTADFDPDGSANHYTAGGYRDAFLSKFSPEGAWLWTKVWGGPSDDRANSVVVCGSNVYVAGCFQDTVDFNPAGGDPRTAPRNTSGFPNNDAYLCLYDTEGRYRWTRTWGGNGGDEAYGLALGPTGSVYVCGDFSTTNMSLATVGLPGCVTNQGRWDAFIFKFGDSGTCFWARCWGGAYYDDCTSVAADGAGNVYGCGMFASPLADFDPGPDVCYQRANNPGSDWGLVDVFLTKLDAAGDFQWARCWGESNHWDAGQGIAVDSATNVYVSGYFTDRVDFNPLGTASNIASRGGDDAFLCRYSGGGEFAWAVTWGGSSNDYARRITVDEANHVYVSGDIASTNADFDPGTGSDWHASKGRADIALSKFDAHGRLLLARTCGGGSDDGAYGGVAVDGAGGARVAGGFAGVADFGAITGGAERPAARGTADAFLARIQTACKVTVTSAGCGSSSLGGGPRAERWLSLGVATQIVYTAADWHRIRSLAVDSTVQTAAAGQRTYTQRMDRATADFSNAVVFALATPSETGYPNVPTEWLAQWPESALVQDPLYDVDAKYRLGLDPTTLNTIRLRIEALRVSDQDTVTQIRRVHTGGLSPDGMHGVLELQAGGSPGSSLTNIPGTAATGAAAFDAEGLKSYTNTLPGPVRVIRAVIR